MTPKFGINSPQTVKHISQKAFFKHALETEGEIGIPRDWTTVIQVVDHGTSGSKQQWGTSIQVDHKKHRITITRINIAAEKISGKISKTTEKDPLAELIWKMIVDRQPNPVIPKSSQINDVPEPELIYSQPDKR